MQLLSVFIFERSTGRLAPGLVCHISKTNILIETCMCPVVRGWSAIA